MKAAVLTGPFDLKMEDRPLPVPSAEEALVRMKAAGICGSDIHFYEGTHPYKNYPRIHGHELAGVVVEVPGTGSLQQGDHVAIEPLLNCGTCYPCRIGKYNCCANLRVIGAHVDGGFAEFVKVPVNRLHRVPGHVPFDIAATAEPYSIGAQVTRRAMLRDDDTVLVIGAGAIGLAVIDFIKLRGIRVYVAEVSPFRAGMAKQFGADLVINPMEEDLNQRVMELTSGEGMPVVIEATGVTSVMENLENLVAAGGRIIIAGLTNDKVAFTGINFTKREMTILGSRNSANIFPYVIDTISSGKLHPDILITHRFPFSEINKAMDFSLKNLPLIGKVIIEF